jgi:hypothetical protein
MVARYRLPVAGRRAGHGPALGARHVQGLFLLPIIGDRGWTRESIGFAMAVQNLTWASRNHSREWWPTGSAPGR